MQIKPKAEEIHGIVSQLNDLYARHPQYSQEYFGKVKSVQKHYLVCLFTNV